DETCHAAPDPRVDRHSVNTRQTGAFGSQSLDGRMPRRVGRSKVRHAIEAAWGNLGRAVRLGLRIACTAILLSAAGLPAAAKAIVIDDFSNAVASAVPPGVVQSGVGTTTVEDVGFGGPS